MDKEAELYEQLDEIYKAIHAHEKEIESQIEFVEFGMSPEGEVFVVSRLGEHVAKTVMDWRKWHAPTHMRSTAIYKERQEALTEVYNQLDALDDQELEELAAGA